VPGSKNMFVGAMFFAFGLIITVITFAVSGGNFILFAYGAIFAGVIQFLIGAAQRIAFEAKSPVAKVEHALKTDVRVLVRAMIAVSAADSHLHDSEVLGIQMVCNDVLNIDLPESEIKKIFDGFDGNHEEIVEEICDLRKQMTEAGRRTALLGCSIVAMSDGKAATVENELLFKLGAAFEISNSDIHEICQEGFQIVRDLVARQ